MCSVISEYFDCLWDAIPWKSEQARPMSSVDVFTSCLSRIFYSGVDFGYHPCADVCRPQDDDERSVAFCKKMCLGSILCIYLSRIFSWSVQYNTPGSMSFALAKLWKAAKFTQNLLCYVSVGIDCVMIMYISSHIIQILPLCPNVFENFLPSGNQWHYNWRSAEFLSTFKHFPLFLFFCYHLFDIVLV